MLAAVFKDINNLVVEDYPLRALKENELLVKVHNCGICATDQHIFNGKAPAAKPVILGHEFAGAVSDLGSGIERFKVGDKVAVDPNIYCGSCNYCRKGKPNFCENHKALGVTLNGGFAESIIIPSSQAYILPDNFDLSKASFAEPVSCCLRGIELADIKNGDNVVIIGGGTIGLIMLQLIKLSRAAKIILLEPDLQKRELGIQLGADNVFSPHEKDLKRRINELTQNNVDVVIECVGKKEAIETAIDLAGKGGKVVIFGLAPKEENISVNLQNIFLKELKIYNSFLNPFTFNPAVDLLINNKLKVTELISEKISLEDIPNKFDSESNSQIIKCQVINNHREEVL